MDITPASLHRLQHDRNERFREGVLVSFTTVRHPPAGFGSAPYSIGIVELENGKNVAGKLIIDDASKLKIGQRVTPHMRLIQINPNGLRRYEVVYEVLVSVPVKTEFRGYIIALTGPSGVGKTTVSTVLTSRISQYVERVPIVTTRAPKQGDEDEYIHLEPQEFSDLLKTNAIIAATSIPSATEKRWYGYRESDIAAIWSKGKLPVVITEMHLLQGLSSHFGRRSILSFGLLPPGKSKRQMLSSLLRRLRSRGRDTEEQIEDRIKNAEADLAFFETKQELFDHLLVNDKLETVLEHLKGHVMKYAEEPMKS